MSIVTENQTIDKSYSDNGINKTTIELSTVKPIVETESVEQTTGIFSTFFNSYINSVLTDIEDCFDLSNENNPISETTVIVQADVTAIGNHNVVIPEFILRKDKETHPEPRIQESDMKVWERLENRSGILESNPETMSVITFMETVFSKGKIVIAGTEYGGLALNEDDPFEISDQVAILKILNESKVVFKEAPSLSIQIGTHSVTIHGDLTKFGTKKRPNYNQIICMVNDDVVLRFINVMYGTQIKTYIVPSSGNAYQVDSLTKEGMNKLLSIPDVINFFNNYESNTITSLLNICRFYDI